jgi:hypothetical protein
MQIARAPAAEAARGPGRLCAALLPLSDVTFADEGDTRAGRGGETIGWQKERPCFLKKRSKKLLSIWAGGIRGYTAQEERAKVFWFFFSKKNALLSSLLSRACCAQTANSRGD